MDRKILPNQARNYCKSPTTATTDITDTTPSEEEKAIAIQQDFSNALRIIEENKEKPIQEIAKIVLSQAPIASYIMTNYAKEDIIFLTKF